MKTIVLLHCQNGKVTFSVYSRDFESVMFSFENLKGKPGDPQSSVVLISIDWDDLSSIKTIVKKLPVIETRPTAYEIGVGEIKEN